MTPVTEIRLAPAVASMNAFLEPHRSWFESVLECPLHDALTLEYRIPFGQLVGEDLLKGAVLDRQCLSGTDALRPAVLRWELPPNTSPRIELIFSRDRGSAITAREPAWDPHWKETPVAVWLDGLAHAVVAVSIPYVSASNGFVHKWKNWLLINRVGVASTLNLLRRLLASKPRAITVLGGRDIPLQQNSGWDSVVLDQCTSLLRDDFEFFLQREEWFNHFRLPFRRGYLLYGPPGNGKTSAIRAMVSHKLTSAFTLDFSNEELHNGALTELFEAASHEAPSLVIFEDLDRLYGMQPTQNNRTKITLQHLLNCLDGLSSQEGVIVVATANDPAQLDPAILRRPGRFDRVVPFQPPSRTLRLEYLRKLSAGLLADEDLEPAAEQTDGFSFAQIREVYILAGQLPFERGEATLCCDHLLEGIQTMRNGARGIGGCLGTRQLGFASFPRTAPG